MHFCGKTTRVLHADHAVPWHVLPGPIFVPGPYPEAPSQNFPSSSGSCLLRTWPKVNWKNMALLASPTMPLKKGTRIIHLVSKHSPVDCFNPRKEKSAPHTVDAIAIHSYQTTRDTKIPHLLRILIWIRRVPTSETPKELSRFIKDNRRPQCLQNGKGRSRVRDCWINDWKCLWDPPESLPPMILKPSYIVLHAVMFVFLWLLNRAQHPGGHKGPSWQEVLPQSPSNHVKYCQILSGRVISPFNWFKRCASPGLAWMAAATYPQLSVSM